MLGKISFHHLLFVEYSVSPNSCKISTIMEWVILINFIKKCYSETEHLKVNLKFEIKYNYINENLTILIIQVYFFKQYI